jgi:hypothetical protein
LHETDNGGPATLTWKEPDRLVIDSDTLGIIDKVVGRLKEAQIALPIGGVERANYPKGDRITD